MNQRAQLDVYARALAGLKQQNRELKRELKRTRRQSRSAKHAARVLLRRASFRKVTPHRSPPISRYPQSPGQTEPEIDVEIASPRPKLVEFTVDRAAIESRFDSSYYAREHDLPDTARAWDQYLVHGIPQGASINFAHHQALGSWNPESNRWLLALKVLRLRQPDYICLPRSRSVSSIRNSRASSISFRRMIEASARRSYAHSPQLLLATARMLIQSRRRMPPRSLATHPCLQGWSDQLPRMRRKPVTRLMPLQLAADGERFCGAQSRKWGARLPASSTWLRVSRRLRRQRILVTQALDQGLTHAKLSDVCSGSPVRPT